MYIKYSQKEKLAKVEKDFTEQVKTAFGTNLHSIIVYGSILTETFNPIQSDINVLIIPKEADPERIVVLGKYCAKLIREYNITPTVMSYDEFISSANIFPMEYYDIKDIHKTIYGEDIMDKIVITDSNLRHQVEDRLRGCINSLRQVLLLSESDHKLLTTGIKNTQGLYNAIFRAILRLNKHPEISFDFKKNLDAVTKYIDFDPHPFVNMCHIFKDSPVEDIVSELVIQLLVIVKYVDNMATV